MVRPFFRTRSTVSDARFTDDPIGLSEKEEMIDSEETYDRVGEEMSPTAKIWTIYLQRARVHDKKMIENWDNGLDVLLVFAGLFSSVLTTFLVQASNALSPEPNASTNGLLEKIVLLLENTTTGGTSGEVIATFTSPTSARFVNGLWFFSLALALSAALASILAKQWLQAYLPRTRGSLQEQVHDRQALFDALRLWRVDKIIEGLPILLHGSLLLFFAGLVIFVWSLDPVIGAIVLAIVAALTLLYGSALLMPLLSPTCPYRNPALQHIAPILHILFNAVSSALNALPSSSNCFNASSKRSTHSRRGGNAKGYRYGPGDQSKSRAVLAAPEIPDIGTILLDISSLTWLTRAHTDLTVQEALVHSIAGAPLQYAKKFQALVDAPIGRLIRHKGLDLLAPTLSSSVRRENLQNAELYCRASVKLSWPCTNWTQRPQTFVWPGFSEEMLDIAKSEVSETYTPVHIYLTASAHILSERVLSSKPLSQEKKVQITTFLSTFKFSRDSQLGYSRSDDDGSGTDPDISLIWLFLDCLARYLTKHPLSPVDLADGWTTAVLQFLLGIMVYTNGNPISSELRIATTHALYCGVCSDLMIGKAPEALEEHRFDYWSWASDFMGPVCYRLLDPEQGWIPWLREHDLYSLVVASLCWYNPPPTQPLLHLESASIVQRLATTVSEDNRDESVYLLKRQDCTSLLSFWHRILAEDAAATRRNLTRAHDAATIAFLSDLSPFLLTVRHALPHAWSQVNLICRMLFDCDSQASYHLDAIVGFRKANAFPTIVQTIRREYAAISRDTGTNIDSAARDAKEIVKKNVGHLIEALCTYTKLLLRQPGVPALPYEPEMKGEVVRPGSRNRKKSILSIGVESLTYDSTPSPTSPDRAGFVGADPTDFNGCVEQIFDEKSAESDIFALFLEYPQLSYPLQQTFASDSPASMPLVSSNEAELLHVLYELRPHDARWREVHATLARVSASVKIDETFLQKLEQRFAQASVDVDDEKKYSGW